MKHLIIGSGVVGEATGVLLESHEETICFHDVDKTVLDKLKKKPYPVAYNVDDIDFNSYDLLWICTAEWHIPKVMETMKEKADINTKIIVRTTTPPGEMQKISDDNKHFVFAHVPEFLKAKTYIEDIFNPDRIIIGTDNSLFGVSLRDFYMKLHPGKPVMIVTPTESELIKLASNGILSTLVSYWNEILKICKKYDSDPQTVANGCTLDHRISKYGSKMIDEPFGGFCLPKDLVALQRTFADKKITSEFLDVISGVNKKVNKVE